MGANQEYLDERALLPPDGRGQEPLVYWLRKIFDRDRSPEQDGGMNLVLAESDLLHGLHVQAADRLSAFNRLTIVGQVAVGGRAAEDQFEVTLHTELPNGPDSCNPRSSCRAFVVNATLGAMTELGVEDPRDFPLDPNDLSSASVIRARTAGAVRKVATDGPEHDPATWAGGDEAYELYLAMATHHSVDESLHAVLRQATQ